MSTNYYRLKSPVTSILLDKGESHDRLTVWVDGVNCGTLNLESGTGQALALFFVDEEEDNECPFRTHWGGKDRGTVVTEHNGPYPDDMIVVSEYGEVLSVTQVRARDGAHRTDGLPTELFGYESKQG